MYTSAISSHNSSYADDLRRLHRGHQPSPREGEESRRRLALGFSNSILNDFINLFVSVSSFSVVLEDKVVNVKGTISYADILAKLKKTGKKASFFIFHRDDANCPHIILLR